ncbi:unnamed protein product [Parajaminaea phylloscopi]
MGDTHAGTRVGLQLSEGVTTALNELRDSLEDSFVLLGYDASTLLSSPSLSTASSSLFEDSGLTLASSSKLPQRAFVLCVTARGSGANILSSARHNLSRRDQVQWCVLQMSGERPVIVQSIPAEISGASRARGHVHGRQLARLVEGARTVSISNIDDLTEDLVTSTTHHAGHSSVSRIDTSRSPGPPSAVNVAAVSSQDDAPVEMLSQPVSPAPPPLPAKDGETYMSQLQEAWLARGKSDLASSRPVTLLRPDSDIWPMPSSPLEATDALKDLQGRWSQSSDTSLVDNFASYGSLMEDRWNDHRATPTSEASETPSVYAVLQEKHIDHPLDKPLPPLAELAESSHHGSLCGAAPLTDDTAVPTWLTSGFDRVSIPPRSSHSSSETDDRRLQMPNPHSRKESMWHRRTLSEERERQRELNENEQEFLRFQEAEKQRVAQVTERERKSREQKRRQEDEEKRRQVILQLKAEQSELGLIKRQSTTSSTSSSKGPPPSEPLPMTPAGPRRRLPRKALAPLKDSTDRRLNTSPPREPASAGQSGALQAIDNDGGRRSTSMSASVSGDVSISIDEARTNSEHRRVGKTRSASPSATAVDANVRSAAHERHSTDVAVSPRDSGSPTAFTRSLLDARRERRAIRQDGGSDGISWVSKVATRTFAVREVSEDDFEDLKAKPYVRSGPCTSPRLFQSSLPLQSTTGPAIMAEKDLPRPPPLSPATAAAFGVDKMPSLMSREELADDARRRALAMEQVAQEQIRAVRELQKRLEFELSEVKRRGQERSEAETAARAKWARDQAQRNALDAYERSKLEHAERQRRAAVEATRLDEERKAREVQAEKQKAEADEREALEEARRRKESRELRELRLKEERQRLDKAAAEREERKRLVSEERERLKGAMLQKLEETPNGSPVLEGLLRAQFGESSPWRTRYFELRRDDMVFFKGPKERVSSPLESLKLSTFVPDGPADADDSFEFCQAPNSCLLHFAREQGLSDSDEAQGQEASGDSLLEVTMAFATDQAKEAFVAAFDVLTSVR